MLVANWKQNHRWATIEHYVAQLRHNLPACFSSVSDENEPDFPLDLVLCSPFPYIGLLGGLLDEAGIYLGAQDCSRFGDGAHTGEVSAAMLADLGCDYCIVGHSERRGELGEDDAACQSKLAQLASEQIIPILCVGESLQIRESGDNPATEYVLAQLNAVREQLQQLSEVVVAYEPIWAIGSGRSASTQDAQSVAVSIRSWLNEHLDDHQAAASCVLYGGSVDKSNIAGYLAQADIDGLLIGGASLNADSFADLAHACLAVVTSAGDYS
jgi:triosephosphate isomerase